jgi:hypothetical protein
VGTCSAILTIKFIGGSLHLVFAFTLEQKAREHQERTVKISLNSFSVLELTVSSIKEVSNM